MRVLFLADTHLGFDQPASPRIDRRRRGPDFFRNYELALAPAFAGEVDVVVHGGDLLYRSRVPDALVETALAPLHRLASRGVPVILIPGNHERSRIPVPLFQRHPLLHVLDGPRTVGVSARGLRVAFAGFPYAPEVRRRFPELLAATGFHEAEADVRVLCLHHCVEGATCGPVGYTFRDGADVIRRRDLPREAAVVLTGHVHRHQALPPLSGGPAVIYPGSVERTSFAEREETKGYVRLGLSARGLVGFRFCPLPARPMVERTVAGGGSRAELEARLRRLLAALPADAVVRLRFEGAGPEGIGAEALRALAPPGMNVEIAVPRAEVPARHGAEMAAGAARA